MKRASTNKSPDEDATKKSRARGLVRVGKHPGRFSGQGWPELVGFTRINVTSGSKGIWKQLSPFHLGPIEVSKYGWNHATDPGEKVRQVEMPLIATNVENVWQASKVWTGEENAIDKIPIKEFFTRRSAVWTDPKAHRHIKKGKGPNKNVPLYSLWGTQKLSYVEARKKIYCPIYSDLVKKTEAYKELERRVSQGENLLLIEYDGYDEVQEKKSLSECLNDASRPFGHGLVLKCLLTGEEPWNMPNYMTNVVPDD